MRELEFRSLYVETQEPGGARELVWEAVELILGDEVEELEAQLCAMTGAAHCVAVSDAASGMALALRAAGVGPGDTVLCAALGCGAPVQGILLAGAAPVFADINPNTYNIDPFCLEFAVGKLVRNRQPMPKALIATDLFGSPCDFPALAELCERFGMVLIEDMTGAFGAALDGVACGNFGRFSVASFAASPLDELGGAAVFCRERGDWLALGSLRRSGDQQALDGRDQPLPRMGSVDLSAVGEGLKLFQEELAQRRKVAALYRDLLEGVLRTQKLLPGAQSACSQMVAVLPDGERREAVLEALAADGIPAGAPQPGKELAFSAWNRVMLINTLSVSRRLVSLPIHPYLGTHIVEGICESLLKAVGE